MIPNSKIQNVKVPFPAIEGMSYSPLLDKIRISNLYQQWNGQTIGEIANSHQDNPFTLRIGLPHVDEQLKNDRVFFITNYKSYNPITKQIEERQIIPYRNTETIYIGQTTEEQEYKNYSLFAKENIVADDLYLKKFASIKDKSISELIINLVEKVNKLQVKVNQLTAIIQQNPTIYKQ